MSKLIKLRDYSLAGIPTYVNLDHIVSVQFYKEKGLEKAYASLYLVGKGEIKVEDTQEQFLKAIETAIDL